MVVSLAQNICYRVYLSLTEVYFQTFMLKIHLKQEHQLLLSDSSFCGDDASLLWN